MSKSINIKNHILENCRRLKKKQPTSVVPSDGVEKALPKVLSSSKKNTTTITPKPLDSSRNLLTSDLKIAQRPMSITHDPQTKEIGTDPLEDKRASMPSKPTKNFMELNIQNVKNFERPH